MRKSALCFPVMVFVVSLAVVACGSAPDGDSTTPVVENPTPSSDEPAPAPTMASGVTIHVEADGGGDYSTLGAAVEAAPDGATILLGAGEYRLEEPLEIGKPLRLSGAGGGQTEILREGYGPVLSFAGPGPFVAEDITFRREAAGHEIGNVVEVSGGEVSFRSCIFKGANQGAGLSISGSATGVVEDCLATGAQWGARAGIEVREKSTVLVRGNECTQNAFGILVLDEAQPMLEENTCTGNGTAGIGYQDEAGGVARDNECSGNGGLGIGVIGQAQPTLEGNTCTGNEAVGIVYANSAGGVASENDCSRNGLYGIHVKNGAQPLLEGNVCGENGKTGILYEHSAAGEARRNECWGNVVGIAVMNNADPLLEDNDCHDNAGEDIQDPRD